MNLQSSKEALLAFDASRSRIALFATLSAFLLLLLAPTAWNANEEEYFQMAHRAVTPEAFHHYDAAFDASRAQFVSKGIIGALVQWRGYESAHAIARVGMAFLYAFGLALFFAAANVGCIDALLVLTVFLLFDEQLVGGEWLFRGVEFKTFAYAIMSAAFAMALHARWRFAVVLGGVATYMHFLVGGFWTAMLLCLLWRERGFKAPPFKAVLFYLLSIAPLIAIILADQSFAETTAKPQLTADVIYSAIRNPHHVAPFRSATEFLSWLPGLAEIIALILVFAFLQYRGLLPTMGVAALWGACFLVCAFVISYFDRHDYRFGKFYLFRPSSLTLLFALTAVVVLVRRYLAKRFTLAWMSVAAAVVLHFAFGAFQEQAYAALHPNRLAKLPSLVAAVEAHSQPGDVVLLEPYQEMSPKYASLHREIPRPTLVSWKFVPANRAEILKWYDLVLARGKLFAGGCADGIAIEPKPALLLTFTVDTARRVGDCGAVVWTDGDVQLLKVSR